MKNLATQEIDVDEEHVIVQELLEMQKKLSMQNPLTQLDEAIMDRCTASQNRKRQLNEMQRSSKIASRNESASSGKISDHSSKLPTNADQIQQASFSNSPSKLRKPIQSSSPKDQKCQKTSENEFLSPIVPKKRASAPSEKNEERILQNKREAKKSDKDLVPIPSIPQQAVTPYGLQDHLEYIDDLYAQYASQIFSMHACPPAPLEKREWVEIKVSQNSEILDQLFQPLPAYSLPAKPTKRKNEARKISKADLKFMALTNRSIGVINTVNLFYQAPQMFI